jgi:hypothetical protein
VPAGDGSGRAAAIATAASLIEFRAVASQLRPLLAGIVVAAALGVAATLLHFNIASFMLGFSAA